MSHFTATMKSTLELSAFFLWNTGRRTLVRP